MCAINGFNFHNKKFIEQMNIKLIHRGPDDSGILECGSWSLGANRLAIIDLSKAGHQPMQTEDGRFTIIMNGEIYNFNELRKELEQFGEKFFSKSDTEVVLKAYRRWGQESLQRLNGMFSFAIHDSTNDELFIARDRLGIKPLYYYSRDGKFIFSSEIKGILEHAIPRVINRTALNMYFRMLYVPAPYTMFEDIFKLKPGHFIRVKNGDVAIEEYWRIQNKPLITDRSYICEEVKHLLENSVRIQTVSDRPVGVFLSGGVDSTIVTGVMSRYSKHVRTFSVGFTDTPETAKYNNDARIARLTAAHFGTEHHEYTLSARDVEKSLERTAYHMDEPISNHVQSINLLLADAVRQEATVVLGGDGGDELFGGYERYYYSRHIDILRNVPGIQLLHPALATQPGLDRYLYFFTQKENIVKSLLKTGWNDSTATSKHFRENYFKTVDLDFTRQFMRTDIQTWLSDESLMRSDKMSMAASIEHRVPFLDHRLVEFADRIPVRYKLGGKGLRALSVGKGYKGKTILKESMAEYLPKFVLDQSKWGWFSPAAKWLRSDLKTFAQEVLSPTYCDASSDIFDFVAVQKIFEDHVSGESYGLTPLWAVLTFQLWCRQYLS